MKKTRVLTGITTSGTPHLGNYAGAIRPAVEASRLDHVDAFFFMADYHALIKCDDPQKVARSRLEIAATWLAAGLDPTRVTFYRQSDIPEIPELSWILTCMTPKGLMNRAHAYKACVDINQERGQETDDGVTMGLYSYPILMAADILMFNAHQVPVGRDQIQHLEMARDIAQRFNHHYGQGREYFVLPEVKIDDEVATLPGLDGRKMSKSYGNTIPLFEGSPKDLKTAIARIQTDSRLPGEPKDAENSHLYTIYRAFSDPAQSAQFKQELEAGMAWGQAKDELYQLLETSIAPMREQYQQLMAKPQDIEEILMAGAAKARAYATPFIHDIRLAVGLRNVQVAAKSKAESPKKSAKTARFVSFREDSGEFKFRLLAADGQELLLSKAFANPKDAGVTSRQLVQTAESLVFSIASDYSIQALLNGEAVANNQNANNQNEATVLVAMIKTSLAEM